MALIRRDGQSLGRVLLGIAQFGAVWLAYVGVAAGIVTAAAGLTHGILAATLHVDTFSGINLSASWPRNVDDVVVATVLGILSLLLVIPAAFFYLVIMFVREAALIILLATAPISAAGLLADASKVWFWKSLRWFIACALISPTGALVLGIGMQVSAGVVSGAGDKTAAAAGMAVVGCVSSRSAPAARWCCSGCSRSSTPPPRQGRRCGNPGRTPAACPACSPAAAEQRSGSSAATQPSGDGRSGGESAAESQTTVTAWRRRLGGVRRRVSRPPCRSRTGPPISAPTSSARPASGTPVTASTPTDPAHASNLPVGAVAAGERDTLTAATTPTPGAAMVPVERRHLRPEPPGALLRRRRCRTVPAAVPGSPGGGAGRAPGAELLAVRAAAEAAAAVAL